MLYRIFLFVFFFFNSAKQILLNCMFYKKETLQTFFLNIYNSYLQFKTVDNNCNNAISIIKMLQNIFFVPVGK